MRSRAPAAFVLSAFLAATVSSRPPAGGQPDPKTPPESKSPTKLPEPKWPTEIAGRNLKSWLQDLTDPDPAIRESALRTIPAFGPEVRKQAGKILISRMKFPSDGGEKDPGVRITLFNTATTIGFDDPKDEAEAIRILGVTADQGLPGGLSRLHAVQTLANIGPKAEATVNLLTGVALNDPSYETRRSIARTLGQISFSETRGPNVKALQALAGTLAKDVSVAVRMEALQALVLLGPPWAEVRKPDDKMPPKINQKSADFVAEAMRARIGGGKSKVVETDKQVEIWCRVVLMRFDPKEINDEQLSAIARHCLAKDAGPKIQALQALGLFGEQAGSKADAVVAVLDDDDLIVITTAINTLASMGVKAQGAIPALETLEKKLIKLREETLKKPEVIKLFATLKPEEQTRAIDSLQEEQLRKTVVNVIKWIKDSKPGMPGGDRKEPGPG
jgi:HEAT repeat protein